MFLAIDEAFDALHPQIHPINSHVLLSKVCENACFQAWCARMYSGVVRDTVFVDTVHRVA